MLVMASPASRPRCGSCSCPAWANVNTTAIRLATPAPISTASAAAREASSPRASRAVPAPSAPPTFSPTQTTKTSAAASEKHRAATDHDAPATTASAAATAPTPMPTLTRRAASPLWSAASVIASSFLGIRESSRRDRWLVFPSPAAARHGCAMAASNSRPRVVIIGSGFAGLFAVQRLKRAPVAVTVIDRATHHLFQPLLYQVATGILSEGEIAPPTRDILRHQRNARVAFGEVTGIDLAARTVTWRSPEHEHSTPYDNLIVAAGAGTSYYGHDEFAADAPGLKTIDDALEVRGRIFGAFEMAEIEDDPVARAAWLTFVIVGGGPTGVELAGRSRSSHARPCARTFARSTPARRGSCSSTRSTVCSRPTTN